MGDDTTAYGWNNPPPGVAPLDHEPAFRPTHPIRKGLIAAWCVAGFVGVAAVGVVAAPFTIIVVAAAAIWLGVLACLIPRQ